MYRKHGPREGETYLHQRFQASQTQVRKGNDPRLDHPLDSQLKRRCKKDEGWGRTWKKSKERDLITQAEQDNIFEEGIRERGPNLVMSGGEVNMISISSIVI